MTLRLSEEEAEQLAAVARVDDVPVAQVVREAIAEHIAARRADPEFQERRERALRDHRRVLDRLARM